MSTITRDKTIDFVKGFGMLLVLFAHINYIEPVHTIIYSFHMPLFFIVSGMLFNDKKHKKFKSFLLTRIKTILLPYLFFAFFSLIFSSFLLLIDRSFTLDYVITQTKLILLDRTYFDVSEIHNNALWFLPCLFVVEILYYWVNKIKHPIIFFGTISTLVILGWILGGFSWALLPWNLRSAIFSIGFYAIGNRILRPLHNWIKLNSVKSNKNYIYIYIICTIISLASVVPIALANGTVGLGSSTFSDGIMFYESGVLGTVFAFSLSMQLSGLKGFQIINYVGKNSLYFMGIHCLFRSLIYYVFERFNIATIETINSHWGFSIIVFVVLFVLTFVTVIGINFLRQKKRDFRNNRKEFI